MKPYPQAGSSLQLEVVPQAADEGSPHYLQNFLLLTPGFQEAWLAQSSKLSIAPEICTGVRKMLSNTLFFYDPLFRMVRFIKWIPPVEIFQPALVLLTLHLLVEEVTLTILMSRSSKDKSGAASGLEQS